MRKLIFLILFLPCILHCVSVSRTGGLKELDLLKVYVNLPTGWVRISSPTGMVLTREGVLLQSITIKKISINTKLQHTKKEIEKDMLPQEVAEVIIDDRVNDSTILDFEIIENTPVEIGIFRGFKFVSTYKNGDGLKYKCIYYGFVNSEWFYSISYAAPQRYYFEKDILTFEEVLKGFKLIEEI